jgi:hypothetical protein
MENLVTLLLVVVLAVVAFRLVRPRPRFVVAIRNRRAVARRGHVPRGFLQDCDAIVAMYEIPDGSIRVYESGASTRLVFSPSIPAEYHQNFRNVWHSSRVS